MPKVIYNVYIVGRDGRVRMTTETSLRGVKSLCEGINLTIKVYRNGYKILWRDWSCLSGSCNKFSSDSILMRRRMSKSGYLFDPPRGIPVSMKVLDK